MEGIYIIHTRESIKCKEKIYKIGCSYNLYKRIKQYPKNSKVLFLFVCDNCRDVESCIKKYFNIKESYPIEMFVSIFEPGDHLSEHVDTDGKYKFFELACVLYLNNFEEGDICFPNLKYSYKPKKSDLIIFPCDGNKSLHKTIISKDERITISAWYGFDKNKQIGYLK